MALPTEKTPRKEKLTDYSLMLYGASGLGKTTFASQAPDCLFLATEPGTNAIDAYVQPVHSWMELCEALGDLVNTKHNFKSVCIDTADNAYMFCSEHVCKQRGIKGPEEQDATKSYPPITREFKRVFTRLAHLDIGLITIAHSKIVKVKTKVSEYDKTIPAMPGGPGTFLVGLHDIVMLATVEARRDENETVTQYRALHTKPSVEHDACDRTNRLPETLPLSYDEVQKAFKKGEIK